MLKSGACNLISRIKASYGLVKSRSFDFLVVEQQNSIFEKALGASDFLLLPTLKTFPKSWSAWSRPSASSSLSSTAYFTLTASFL